MAWNVEAQVFGNCYEVTVQGNKSGHCQKENMGSIISQIHLWRSSVSLEDTN